MVKSDMDYNVYILCNRMRGTLYVGMSSDLHGRISQHKQKLLPGFTKKYGIDKLVYYESFDNAAEASHREGQLKRYRRSMKYNLIEENNPEWHDLAADWYS